jgi:hypothetical protein
VNARRGVRELLLRTPRQVRNALNYILQVMLCHETALTLR